MTQLRGLLIGCLRRRDVFSRDVHSILRCRCHPLSRNLSICEINRVYDVAEVVSMSRMLDYKTLSPNRLLVMTIKGGCVFLILKKVSCNRGV